MCRNLYNSINAICLPLHLALPAPTASLFSAVDSLQLKTEMEMGNGKMDEASGAVAGKAKEKANL